MRRSSFLLLAAAAAVLPARRAEAHLVGLEFGDFYAGALHLGGAPEHLAILVGLGLTASVQPRERARWMLAALPAGLFLGIVAGGLSGAPEVVLPVLPVSIALVGLIGVAALRLPIGALVAIAGVSGFLHGYVNGLPLTTESVDWRLYTLGAALAGTVLGTFAIAVASVLRESASWAPLAQQVVSSWMTAVGVILIGASVAGV